MTSTSDASNKIIQQRQRRTLLWTIGSFFFAIISLLLLSTIDGEDGKPILETSVIVQVISIFGLIASVTLPSLIGARRDAAVVREQVQNSHSKPLRDDQDEKHDTVMDRLDRLQERMDGKFEGVASDIRGIRRDVGRVSDQGMRTQDAIITLADRVDRNKDSVDVVTKALEVRIESLEESDGR